MSYLEVKKLTKHFGGIVAIKNLSFDVEKGEILALIGPNGAGKSTLFNLITSTLTPSKGEILFKNKDITNLKTHLIAQLGIARTFQKTSVFMEMSVIENILVAHNMVCKTNLINQIFFNNAAKKVEEGILENAINIIEFIGLQKYENHIAGSLPHGVLRLLEIAIAMAMNPELLLLDEPFTGMNTGEVKNVIELVKNINNNGVTIIIVEHNIQALLNICKRMLVINFGEKIAEGCPKECINNQNVIEAYLGKEMK